MSAADVGPALGAGDLAGMLKGFRVGVTSHRRSQDLIEALERRGAEVLHAPVLTIAPVDQDLGVRMRLEVRHQRKQTRNLIGGVHSHCDATSSQRCLTSATNSGGSSTITSSPMLATSPTASPANSTW